eukprot:TRINITY_DN13334_c0_g1_i4.p1 TRINITY_DN13334_c0_g1~~TRINITY_DN13334_c0_g1_i4.p1  ORF type:complete len:955 (-),score=143.81 TRINITY_DN13334_c0_g1_i4:81-2831(-)
MFTAVGRFMLLPYLWAAVLYALAGKPLYRFPLGPQDLVLLTAAVTPRKFLGTALVASWSVVAWTREESRLLAVGLAVASLSPVWLAAAERGVVFGGGALSASASTAAACPVSPAVLLGLCLLMASPRGRLRFVLGCPSAWALSFPKLIRDDWTWRIDTGPWGVLEQSLRRFVLWLLPVLRKPVFDSSWVFDQDDVRVDWGSPDHWPVSRATDVNDAVVKLDLWEDLSALPSLPPRPPVESTSCNGNSKHGVQSSVVDALTACVEKVGGRPPSLASLDSLQAISLAESVRRDFGFAISVADILRASDVHDLATKLAAGGGRGDVANGINSGGSSASSAAAAITAEGAADEQGYNRVYMMPFGRAPIDWCVRFAPGMRMDVAAMQRALDRLVARHSALQTVQTPDEPLRQAMDMAAAVWQLVVTCIGGHSIYRLLSPIVANSLFWCWPRTFRRSAYDARVSVRTPTTPRKSGEDVLAAVVRFEEGGFAGDDDDFVFWATQDIYRQRRWPFDVLLVPLLHSEPSADFGPLSTVEQVAAALPPESVTWYLVCSITHAYSDGAAGQALFRDLLRLYSLEVEFKADEAPVQEHLALLQRRLRQSLIGRTRSTPPDPGHDVYHEVACEDWGKRLGAQKRILLTPRVLNALQMAATQVIGVGVDVAWLTALSGAMFRLFPHMPCLYLILMCACRDGPGEAEMVGYLSDQRVVHLDLGDGRATTMLDIAQTLDATRRARTWRAPAPYEAGLCVYVNVVSSMLTALPSPASRQVTRKLPLPSGWNAGWTDAYSHVNVRLDQRTEVDWDLRLFHWDAAWGWEWSTSFAQALGAVIVDMATSPASAAVVPPAVVPPESTSEAVVNGHRQPQAGALEEVDMASAVEQVDKVSSGERASVKRTWPGSDNACMSHMPKAARHDEPHVAASD